MTDDDAAKRRQNWNDDIRRAAGRDPGERTDRQPTDMNHEIRQRARKGGRQQQGGNDERSE